MTTAPSRSYNVRIKGRTYPTEAPTPGRALSNIMFTFFKGEIPDWEYKDWYAELLEKIDSVVEEVESREPEYRDNVPRSEWVKLPFRGRKRDIEKTPLWRISLPTWTESHGLASDYEVRAKTEGHALGEVMKATDTRYLYLLLSEDAVITRIVEPEQGTLF